MAKYEAGNIQAAIADYSRAIELDPKNAAPYNNRGNAKYKNGDKKGAIKDLNRAAELFRQQPTSNYEIEQ